ncbi:MAG: hypothetical protein KGM17_13275 [Sphingomonadales bacterium]|nr:hypothetical protein [Sphingomonadales bacterium]
MMFGPRLSTVFASRWKALAWSASILLTAYCTVPKPSENGAQPQDQEAVAMVKAVLPAPDAAAEPTRSPWAPDKARTAN